MTWIIEKLNWYIPISLRSRQVQLQFYQIEFRNKILSNHSGTHNARKFQMSKVVCNECLQYKTMSVCMANLWLSFGAKRVLTCITLAKTSY